MDYEKECEKNKTDMSLNVCNQFTNKHKQIIKTAIVFGGASADGKEICEDLVQQKFYTFCIDDLSSENSQHPEFWENVCKDNPRFIFFKEKWEDFIEKEVCIETTIDIVVILVKQHCKCQNRLCEWIQTLVKPPSKVIIKNTSKITKTPMWEFLVQNE